MNEQRFKIEVRRAEEMRQITEDPAMVDYYIGFLRGLRRGYHGEEFGTKEEHETWLSLAESSNKMKQKKGQGYRDGIALVEKAGKMGRPSVGDVVMPAITVSDALKKALEDKASENGLSLADARREAYRYWSSLDSSSVEGP